MARYIDKCAVIAEIERLDNFWHLSKGAYGQALINDLYSFLEVKEISTWHLQTKENIYDAIKDWNLHTFACLMKDGTIQKFTGIADEDYKGHIDIHIDGVNDDYDDVGDIVKWIEYT